MLIKRIIMKKVVLIVIIILAFTFNSNAQNRKMNQVVKTISL